MADLCVVVELTMSRVPAGQRDAVVEIISQSSKSLPTQKRALLLKRGLLRSTAEELEILSETGMLLFIILMVQQ
jgi:translation initiation factor 2-alpha kinase 4